MNMENKPSILIVDDNKENLVAAAASLSSLDAEIITVGTGRGALAALMRKENFALIILDVNMPIMDGYSLAKTIKTYERTKYVPIVFFTMTGQSEEQILKGYEMGAVDYILKPFPSEALKNKSQVYLEMFNNNIEIRESRKVLSDLNKFLENEVTKKTLQLVQEIEEHKKNKSDLKVAKEKLETQNEKLKELDKMKDRILSDVTHELRHPVAIQRMQVDLLKRFLEKTSLHSDCSKIMKTMDTAIDRQESAINNIIHLSHLEHKQQKYELAPTRLDQVLFDTLNDYQDTLESCGIEVKTTLPPMIIISDGKMLYHVFSNLINNAIKFRKSRGVPHLEVFLEERAEKGIVKIADDGIGLSLQEKERIFERFYQVSASTPGSGVGLAIAQTIINDLKGKIWLESAGLDQGTIATVELPLQIG